MTTIEFIKSRQSTPMLTTPGPSPKEWEQVIAAATTAPDHGRLQPWQFRLITGEGLKQLGDIMAHAQEQRSHHNGNPVTEQQLTRTRELPLRAPAILVTVAQILENHKIPVVEQVAAVACATQNAQLALHDLGYGCMWRTGEFAACDSVKDALGFEPKDEILAFLYVGTQQKAPPERTPQALNDCFQHWPPTASTTL